MGSMLGMIFGLYFIICHLWIPCVMIPIPVRVDQEDENRDTLFFLGRYGYDSGRGSEERRLSDALIRYQEFHGLSRTGKLDLQTRVMMKSPRCGLPDLFAVARDREGSSATRYKTLVSVTGNSYFMWRGPKTLPFYIEAGHGQLTRQILYYATALALQPWCTASGLSFLPMIEKGKNKPPEIEVTFSEGDHNCRVGIVFDGPGAILAHAIWPYYQAPYRGDVHMDAAERWGIGLHYHLEEQSNIIWSLMHEFGHVLGVLHTDVNDNSLVMYPHQRHLVPTLGDDDKKAVQSMYGTRNISLPLDNDCGLGLSTEDMVDIDAVTEGVLGETYCFKGGNVFVLYREVSNDYLAFPVGGIQQVFDKAPSRVDAAEFFPNTGIIYLIKDDLVYGYISKPYNSYPRDGKFYKYIGTKNLTAEFGYHGETPIDFLNCEKVNGINILLFYKDNAIVWTYPNVSDEIKSSLQGNYDVIRGLLGNENVTSAFPGTVHVADKVERADYFITDTGVHVRATGKEKVLRKTKWGIPLELFQRNP